MRTYQEIVDQVRKYIYEPNSPLSGEMTSVFCLNGGAVYSAPPGGTGSPLLKASKRYDYRKAMSGEIKILATSDLHLGCKESPVAQDIRLRTFQKIISLAMENDIFLIAGDFIDADGFDEYILKTVNDEFRKLREKGTEILLCPGIAERDGGVYSPALGSIEATRLFINQDPITPYYYENDGQMLLVYGGPADYPRASGQLRTDDDGFHLGLFHVSFIPENTPVAESLPCRLSKEDIKTMGLDFYVFGSNHTFKMFKIQDRIIAAYPGSPEATSIEETGDRYVLSFSIMDNQIQNIRRLAVNTVTVDSTNFDCAGYKSFNAISAEIDARRSKRLHFTATLTGNRDFPIDPDALRKFYGEFYALRLVDRSTPTLEMFFKVYGSEETVRGEMLRIVKDKIQNGDMPAGTNDESITQIIKHLVAGGPSALEDWLCAT